MTRTPHPIQSPDNPRFKRLKRALSGRGIRREGSAVVSGGKLVAEAVAAVPDRCLAWITAGAEPAPPASLSPEVEWLSLSRPLFRAIDTLGTGAPLLWVRTPELDAWRPEDAGACTLLVPFQDPENVGAVIRSAVAFGVDRVVLLEGCAHPFHPRAIRASGGAVFRAPLASGPSIDALPGDAGVIALSSEGRDLAEVRFGARTILLPGVEGPGLPAPYRRDAVAIPIDTRVESLNAATAAAIVLYAWSRQRGDLT